jgi:hypothetical protein
MKYDMKKFFLFMATVLVSGFVSAQTSGLYGSRSGTSDVSPSSSSSSPMVAISGTLLFEENMDNVSLLTDIGWLFYNVDGGGSTTFFQGNTTVFYSYNGSNSSYLAQNYNGANGYLINQWLITPEITSYGETTFRFMARSIVSSYPDHIYIYYSPTGSTNISDFVLLKDRTTLPSTWTQYTQTVTASGPVRFAVRYYETDGGYYGNNSDYWGMDAVQVYGSSAAVPVSKWWVAGLFAFLGIAIVVKRFAF